MWKKLGKNSKKTNQTLCCHHHGGGRSRHHQGAAGAGAGGRGRGVDPEMPRKRNLAARTPVAGKRLADRRRQRRKRRKEVEDARQNLSSDSSDFGEERIPSAMVFEEPALPVEDPEMNWADGRGIDTYHAADIEVTRHEDGARYARNDSEVGGVGGGGEAEPDQLVDQDPVKELANALAAVKASSLVSDSAVEKIFNAVASRAETVAALIRDRRITTSYKRSLRPIALRGIPRVRCSILVEKMNPDGTTTIQRFENLPCIPKKYLRLRPEQGQRILRTCSAISLRDLKKYHARVHMKLGVSAKEIECHFANAEFSIDGVAEGSKGKGNTTFTVVSLRLGGCIYLWKVYQHLQKNAKSKPTLHDLAR